MVAQSCIYSSPLQKAIDRYPLTVTPETPLVDVLKQMSLLQSSCEIPVNTLTNGIHESPLSKQEKATSVLIVEQKYVEKDQKYNAQSSFLLGIFTVSDLVKLIATGQVGNLSNLSENVKIKEVISSNFVTIKESDDQDLFTALSLFRQHKISHLPVLDSMGQIVGVVTPERIRQVLQPSNILSSRRVNEVKNDSFTVTTPETASLLEVSKLMSDQQVNSVIVTQNKKNKTQRTEIDKPVGIITTDDIAQGYYINMSLATTPVKKVMKTPLNCLKQTDSLWDAHKKMLHEQVEILIVCGKQGEFLGTVNQTSLLQVLDPTVMFGLVRKLRKDVNQLQAEKFELLRTRNAQLEKEVQARTAEIQAQLERDRLLAKIALRIHQSLDIDEIINAVVTEVKQFLKTDRVVLFQVETAKVAKIVAESVEKNCNSWMGETISSECLMSNLNMNQNTIQAVSDITQTDSSTEKITELKEKQVKAWLIVPISQDGQLWGLMCTQEGSGIREWQQSEIDFLKQLATQLAIGIQQAQLYQQVQTLNTDLEKQVQDRTAELQQKVRELQQLNILKDDFLSTVSHELRTPLSNMKMAIHMLKVFPVSERGKEYLNILDTECKREIKLITDLLDLQRLEGGTEFIPIDTIDLASWLPTIIDPFKSRAKEREQTLKVKSPKKLPQIVSNNNSLSRILAELLNNACKYTQNGGEIKFIVECNQKKSSKKSLKETPSSIKFLISNPSEIPASELPKIFNKFYRVPNADPWKQGGTGLGLALVKKLVEQLNGNILVTSSNGWTTFTVELPT
ncbi:MAG: CBS domain-containing protein [Okeania sp. SIO2G4]|uniref:CBS domain-containing protein n=1 Tax=unclassified Okeania TaxID=2634635 RepID=UPI0013B9F4FC|nr:MULTISPECIES: CBS domain-containing protein [unclassified Okeania]NEP39678.1 CBS domain-containing protein [Okeania sp. SIO2H7]NEP75185.1 CBS domain-containing protein [Okeania sp. SIO2G5]NEP96224.1 CBS domain-containing protein [Okeania sp. SIO2F5]NEQ93974.1 CBS domain-containing protein [Okeania sp. SIO2G4]